MSRASRPSSERQTSAFDWHREDHRDCIVVPEQAAIAVYLDHVGHVVIHQQGIGRRRYDDDLPYEDLCQELYWSFLARLRFNVNLEQRVRANIQRNSKREHTIAAIAQTLLLHKYNLMIFEEPGYEVRDLYTGEVYWDFEHSNVSLEKFDVDSFLEICGWIEN